MSETPASTTAIWFPASISTTASIPLQRQDDPSGDGHAAAAQPGRPAPRRHGMRCSLGQAEDGGRLLRRLGTDDDVRAVLDFAEREFIVP